MFGIKHIRFDSMQYVIHYVNGRIAKTGRGLSFFYYQPQSSIVAIPLGSNDLPFIFNETTKDYQQVAIQGQISYKVTSPEQLADILDFTVNALGQYKTNDLEKLNQRLINEAQTVAATYIQHTDLKEAIRSGKKIEQAMLEGLTQAKAVALLGVEVLGLNILAISPNPEMRRALETETREKLQQDADEAIYARRNFAVEQERKIKESELNTEIAVEEKQKQIAEKKMESEVLKTENARRLREMRLAADIAAENQREALIRKKAENEKINADTRNYALKASLEPYSKIDWKTLTAIGGKSDPRANIGLAFRELAENADKIGNLNISPDLLESLLHADKK